MMRKRRWVAASESVPRSRRKRPSAAGGNPNKVDRIASPNPSTHRRRAQLGGTSALGTRRRRLGGGVDDSHDEPQLSQPDRLAAARGEALSCYFIATLAEGSTVARGEAEDRVRLFDPRSAEALRRSSPAPGPRRSSAGLRGQISLCSSHHSARGGGHLGLNRPLGPETAEKRSLRPPQCAHRLRAPRQALRGGAGRAAQRGASASYRKTPHATLPPCLPGGNEGRRPRDDRGTGGPRAAGAPAVPAAGSVRTRSGWRRTRPVLPTVLWYPSDGSRAKPEIGEIAAPPVGVAHATRPVRPARRSRAKPRT